MTAHDFDTFPGTKEWLTFQAGQVIFREGDPGSVMYVVIEGQVDIFAHGGLVGTTSGPGGIVGEMALIDAGPRSATAVAMTECTVVPLDKERFLSHIQQVPDFALEVMQVICERLRHFLSITPDA